MADWYIDSNLASLAERAGWLERAPQGHLKLTKTGRHIVLQAKREGVYNVPEKVLVTDE